MNPYTGSLMVIVVGIVSMLGGLVNFFGHDDGPMILTGVVLLASGTISSRVGATGTTERQDHAAASAVKIRVLGEDDCVE